MKALVLFFLLISEVSIAQTSSGVFHVLRLTPGQDVMKELSSYIQSKKIEAASVVSAVGSLTEGNLRFANNKTGTQIKGPLEVVSFSGTTSMEGSHLHLSVSDGKGQTLGGHLLEGNKVFTTLEIVLVEYPELIFKRTLDQISGFKELKVIKK